MFVDQPMEIIDSSLNDESGYYLVQKFPRVRPDKRQCHPDICKCSTKCPNFLVKFLLVSHSSKQLEPFQDISGFDCKMEFRDRDLVECSGRPDPSPCLKRKICPTYGEINYRVCHRFDQAYSLVRFGHGSLILGSSHFLLLPQLPQKMILGSKEVKKDSKIIILLH